MSIVFRVDASQRIGTGHVYRCLALADALRERGASIRFVNRRHPGNLAAVIRERGYELLELRAPDNASAERTIADGDYAEWLGVTEAEDVAETLQVLGSERVDLLIVDHYSLGAAWEAGVASLASRIVAIDDLARAHACDVLLDQNYYHDAERRYDGRLPDKALRLCGPKYALLADDFRKARTFLKPRRGPVARVLVYYGGADLTGDTLRALRVLSDEKYAQIAVDVVVGSSNVNATEIEALAKRRPRTTVHGPRRSILDLMIEADLMIGAGGATTWERFATGLPSMVTAVAANQEGFNEALSRDGLIAYLGTAATVTDASFQSAFDALVHDDAALERMATNGWNVADGWGAQRVAEAICPTRPDELVLRHVSDGAAAGTRVWEITTPAGLSLGTIATQTAGDRDIVSFTLDAGTNSEFEAKALELVAAECESAEITARLSLGAAVDGALSLTILSDRNSWIKQWTPRLAAEWLKAGHSVRLISRVADLEPGDICFLLSVGQVLKPAALAQHRFNLVVHAADLPKGRGWSPLTWRVLEGANEIVVSLLEAGEKVDSGRIYDQTRFHLEGGELLGELQDRVANATVELCTKFVKHFPASGESYREQVGEPTYYRRRTPIDSQIDPERSIAEQFDLLRIVDSERYPAFFTIRGREYTLEVRPRQTRT